MASSSSSATPPTPPPTAKIPQQKHDVFLSFRGEDTRHNFTSHLNAALSRLHIKTFIDYEIQRGNEISPLLIDAIEKAKISIIIFSKNYASSKWCLDELNKIIECQTKKGQIVIPVFFHMDPTHVRNQTGHYAEAFAMHEQIFKHDVNRVLRWKASLVAAAMLAGWHCNMSSMESELVEEIAQDVSKKMDSISDNGIDIRLQMQREITLEKYLNYLTTSSLIDLEDLNDALRLLARLKVEKVLKTNDENDWDDLLSTYKRLERFTRTQYNRTDNKDDYRNWDAVKTHLYHLEEERKIRKQGLPGGI